MRGNESHEPQLAFARSMGPARDRIVLNDLERGGLAGGLGHLAGIVPFGLWYAIEHGLWAHGGSARILLEGMVFSAALGVSTGLASLASRRVAREADTPRKTLIGLGLTSGAALGAVAGAFAAVVFGSNALPYFGAPRILGALVCALLLTGGGCAVASGVPVRLAARAALGRAPLMGLALLLVPLFPQLSTLQELARSLGLAGTGALLGGVGGLLGGGWISLGLCQPRDETAPARSSSAPSFPVSHRPSSSRLARTAHSG